MNEPLSGNKAWHPKAVLSVYLWSLARNNCDVFGKKSSKVLPHGVRMTGHVVGLPSTSGGGAGGGEVLELLKKNEEGGGRTRAITLVLGWRRGPGLARGGRYGRGRWGRGRWFYL